MITICRKSPKLGEKFDIIETVVEDILKINLHKMKNYKNEIIEKIINVTKIAYFSFGLYRILVCLRKITRQIVSIVALHLVGVEFHKLVVLITKTLAQ